MKETVPLRDSTMKAKSHWLEIDKDDGDYFVCLRNASKIIGGERTGIEREVLESLITVLPGVILKNGPLRFYRTEDDVRVSFTEDEAEELTGFDRLDFDEFAKAVRKVIGEDEDKAEHSKARKAPAKKAPAKKKPASRKSTSKPKASKR